MLNENVKFKLGDFSCQGVLHLESNSSFYLELESYLPEISYNPRKIVCFSENQTYVLWQNSISSHRIYPKFIIHGYEYPCFCNIEFDLDGLQDFLSFSAFRNSFVFKEYVKIDGKIFLCECSNYSEKTTINLKTYFRWDDVGKIENIVLRFIQFFSLISYKRIRCSSIRILDENHKYEILSFTYGSFNGDKERHKSLLYATKINWKNILCNFFEDNSGIADGKIISVFDNCLTTFIAQIDSGLFWDYKALGICGIWDQYTKLIGISDKDSSSQLDVKCVEQLFMGAYEYSNKNFSDGEEKVVKEILSFLDSRKKYGDTSLYGRFCALYKSLDESLHRIFPYAQNDILILKEIRDCTAHGMPWNRSQKIFEDAYQAFRRMRLLTIVFIYVKLGIPVIDILTGIRYCYHSCVMNANLNRFVLSSIIGDVPIFDVDEKTWNYFNRARVHTCLKYSRESNQLIADLKTTDEVFCASICGQECFYDSYVKSVNPSYKNPIYQNTLFLRYLGNYKEINGMFILNSEDLPEDIRKICELQRSDLQLKRINTDEKSNKK